MILKTYNLTNQNLSKLHKEVAATNYVSGFYGVSSGAGFFNVHGGALIDEAALDTLIAAHTPVEVPEEITPRQARQALFMSGISEAMIVGALNSLSDPTKTMALIEWEYSTAFLRNNHLVNEVGGALGWSNAQIDALFILGATL
jgi:hypothetical protein